MKTIDYFDILITRIMIWILKRGYGPRCETKDLDDFRGEDIGKSRCPTCEAYEIIDWLEDLIKLTKEYM